MDRQPKAMILSAGLGTRLRPLTDHRPKPLVLLKGRPLIAYALDWLEENKVCEALINIHHFADQMRTFVAQEKRTQLALSIQDESSLLLGSGGAIKKAAPWLFADGTSALVLNADGLLNPNLADMLAAHRRLVASKGVLCTLAVMPHADAGRRYNAFAVDGGMIREHVKADPTRQGNFFHFPGIYLLEAAAMEQLRHEPEAFCIVERLWKPLIAQGKLGAWHYDGHYQDLGTPADLVAAEARLA